MQIIELRADPKLLKNNFDGYKLNLDPIPILKQELSNKVEIKQQSQDQFSFLHAELFTFQNHLHADPWLARTAYFVDENWTIKSLQYQSETGKLKPLSSVYKLPKQIRDPNDYNFDLRFVSEKFCVLSDGQGKLYLFDTGDRLRNAEWKLLFSCQTLIQENQGFLIEDVKLQIESEVKKIHCVLKHIEQSENFFETVINWVVLKQTASSWEKISTKTLKGKGSAYYASLDPKCQGIVLSTKHTFKYFYDSENPIEEIPEKIEEIIAPSEESPSNNFTWIQNEEDITINFKEIHDAEKQDYQVKCESKRLEISCKSQTLVASSDLFDEIDTDLTTWSLQNNFLQLNLIKKNPELVWPYLISGGPTEDKPEGRQDQPFFDTAPVSNIDSQLEDCDIADEEDEYYIERFDGTTHEITHKVFLGQNPPMFSCVQRPGYPKAVSVRLSGIPDCCIFLQTFQNDSWTLKHESTLNCFGYIAASKQESKFTLCSPDCNLGVICESNRHLFLYKSNYDSASGLRRRTGPQSLIGQQKLVTFDRINGEILGISVENDVIILLTENSILCLQLCIEE